MVKNASLVFFLIFFVQHISHAQLVPDTATTNNPHLLFILKFSPLSVVDINATYQFAIEFPLNRRWSVQQDIGYGNHHINIGPLKSQLRKETTWRLRSEVRRYFEPVAYQEPVTYLAIEAFYKQVNFPATEEIGRECDQGACAYFETVHYTFQKDVVGGNFKVGRHLPIEKNFTADLYVGVGYRFILVKSPDSMNDNDMLVWERDIGFNLTRQPGTYKFFNFSLGIKVGYTFYRKSK